MTIPKVLGRTSSINVRKVLWTLDELDLAYEREDWGAGFASTKDPTFLALNPNALVPVLIDEHGALWESNAICRYLATGTPLLPQDGAELVTEPAEGSTPRTPAAASDGHSRP